MKTTKQIILASQSAQRKNLLKMLGIPFVVKPSNAEELSQIKSTCTHLVKHNALLKAREVASSLKEGIVIGCDTVVFDGKSHLILKPKDKKEAKRILKKLFSKPHWVYSGVAVIDAKTKKEHVGVEKTKIFMNALTDKEIDAYHKKVPPYDKAGGFDIEGVGSVFIHRIEGCYTNVIGLPMSKLRVMLKKAGVSLLSLMLMVTMSGCATEFNLATNQQETLMYTTEKEIKIGDSVSERFEGKYEIFTGIEENARVEKILDRIAAVADRKDLVYVIKIVDEDDINALAIPGGYIYVFKGLLDFVDNDDQMAGVIAHEVGHITAKHGLKRLQASYGALLAQIAAVEAGGNVAGGVSFAINSLFFAHSQKAEFEADRLGVKYMTLAGYDPQETIKFLENLYEKKKSDKLRRYSIFKTHPYIVERMAVVSQEISGEMEFRDYIRLIGSDKH